MRTAPGQLADGQTFHSCGGRELGGPRAGIACRLCSAPRGFRVETWPTSHRPEPNSWLLTGCNCLSVLLTPSIRGKTKNFHLTV